MTAATGGGVGARRRPCGGPGRGAGPSATSWPLRGRTSSSGASSPPTAPVASTTASAAIRSPPASSTPLRLDARRPPRRADGHLARPSPARSRAGRPAGRSATSTAGGRPGRSAGSIVCGSSTTSPSSRAVGAPSPSKSVSEPFARSFTASGKRSASVEPGRVAVRARRPRRTLPSPRPVVAATTSPRSSSSTSRAGVVQRERAGRAADPRADDDYRRNPAGKGSSGSST